MKDMLGMLGMESLVGVVYVFDPLDALGFVDIVNMVSVLSITDIYISHSGRDNHDGLGGHRTQWTGRISKDQFKLCHMSFQLAMNS